MTKSVPWESRIGRRIRLRDLHILFAVVQNGGMAKAATSLGMSQPAVSETIAGLEHVLGARLLDRGRRGTVPTIYAEALLRRGRAAFDELRQAVSEIETLSDPAKGEVRVACGESITASFLIRVIQEFRKRYSQVNLHVEHVAPRRSFPRWACRNCAKDALMSYSRGLPLQPSRLNCKTTWMSRSCSMTLWSWLSASSILWQGVERCAWPNWSINPGSCPRLTR
jgi:molybdenum-dependent DNA-binding transcriptional regulator ModE